MTHSVLLSPSHICSAQQEVRRYSDSAVHIQVEEQLSASVLFSVIDAFHSPAQVLDAVMGYAARRRTGGADLAEVTQQPPPSWPRCINDDVTEVRCCQHTLCLNVLQSHSLLSPFHRVAQSCASAEGQGFPDHVHIAEICLATFAWILARFAQGCPADWALSVPLDVWPREYTCICNTIFQK